MVKWTKHAKRQLRHIHDYIRPEPASVCQADQ
uniref:Uncharacterized protein n=1 Tax=Candidatus Kentrum sp. DK TaxID=2126562 RepID=A0A450SLZ4_9GAMM|nr:MAG: hypothetical protein BECKDK2373B_GA0170837_104814 [Candidatus Kentron sp. DK]